MSYNFTVHAFEEGCSRIGEEKQEGEIKGSLHEKTQGNLIEKADRKKRYYKYQKEKE